VEKRKRKRAEEESDLLRSALYQHTRFVRGLASIGSLRPRFSLVRRSVGVVCTIPLKLMILLSSQRLNLCRYLHRPTRLPREQSLRWGDFDATSQRDRLHGTIDVLCHETASLRLTDSDTSFDDDDAENSNIPSGQPVYQCEPVDDGNYHSVTHTSVYAINTTDLGAVVRGACVAIRDVMTLCPLGHSLQVAYDIVDPIGPASSNTMYRVIGVNHRNVRNGGEIFLESHVLTSYIITDEYAIVMWDFVDDDQLHPISASANITREVTGAYVMYVLLTALCCSTNGWACVDLFVC
jgi:hypothetical protein